MPSLSANAVDDSSPEFRRLANRSICLVAFVGIPASIGIILVASDVFSLLHYQAGFEQAVPLLQILALHIPIVGIDMVLGSALIAADRQTAWTIIAGGAAVLNILLNLVAIPLTMHAFGNGAIGAAIVTVGTELFMMVGALMLRPAGIMDRPHRLVRIAQRRREPGHDPCGLRGLVPRCCPSRSGSASPPMRSRRSPSAPCLWPGSDG